MIAYLRGGLVVWIGNPPPAFLQFDEVLPNAVNAVIGKVWNGVAFVNPSAELANAAALLQQADDAIATNLQAITDAQAWLATNTGTLTTAQLSNAMRSVMSSLITAARQRNGVIRLLRSKFDATT